MRLLKDRGTHSELLCARVVVPRTEVRIPSISELATWQFFPNSFLRVNVTFWAVFPSLGFLRVNLEGFCHPPSPIAGGWHFFYTELRLKPSTLHRITPKTVDFTPNYARNRRLYTELRLKPQNGHEHTLSARGKANKRFQSGGPMFQHLMMFLFVICNSIIAAGWSNM